MSAAQASFIAAQRRERSRMQKGFRAVTQSVASKALILALQAGTGILTARELKPWG